MGLSLGQLRSYDNWVGKTPFQVLTDVRTAGGWKRVFEMELTQNMMFKPFPNWASRVRNYFNDVPKTLTILPAPVAKAVVDQYRSKWKWYSFFQKATVDDSAAVYVGDNLAPWNHWITFANGGTVYHFPIDPKLSGQHWSDSDLRRSLQAGDLPSKQLPIFKLACPDGTGGSSEIVIHNHQLIVDSGRDTGRGAFRHGHSTIRGVRPGDPPIRIKNLLVLTPEYRGSYNYSETMVDGFDAHNFRDIGPDKVSSDPMHILWPPRKSTIRSRRFPKFL